jgi:hypothetical protein
MLAHSLNTPGAERHTIQKPISPRVSVNLPKWLSEKLEKDAWCRGNEVKIHWENYSFREGIRRWDSGLWSQALAKEERWVKGGLCGESPVGARTRGGGTWGRLRDDRRGIQKAGGTGTAKQGWPYLEWGEVRDHPPLLLLWEPERLKVRRDLELQAAVTGRESVQVASRWSWNQTSPRGPRSCTLPRPSVWTLENHSRCFELSFTSKCSLRGKLWCVTPCALLATHRS